MAVEVEPAGRGMLVRAGAGKDDLLDSAMLGWDELMAGRLEVRNVSGDHYTMLAGVNARALADELRTYFDSLDV